MSNYNNLKTTIDANIKQNGNQEITGPILNSVLNQMVNILGTGYQFAGIATLDPATEPGTPDAKVFYIANGKGTYTNFGGIEVTEDEVVVLYWDSAWHKVATGIASQAKLSELEQKTDTLIPQVDENTKAIKAIAVSGGASVASAVIFDDGENAEIKQRKNISEKETNLVYLGGNILDLASVSYDSAYWRVSNGVITFLGGSNASDFVFNQETIVGKPYLIRSTQSSGTFENAYHFKIGNGYEADGYTGTNRVDASIKADGGYLHIIPISGETFEISAISMCPLVNSADAEETLNYTVNNIDSGNSSGTLVDGKWNTAIGSRYDTMPVNIGGSRSIAIGYQALKRWYSGLQNIAIGTFSMLNLEHGERNIAIGADSLYHVASCKDSIAIGKASMGTSASFKFDNSVALGNGTMSGSGDKLNCVAVGKTAMSQTYTNLTDCIAIGANTTIRKNGSTSTNYGNISNTIVIGTGVSANDSNQVVIGNNQIKSFVFGGRKVVFGFNFEINASETVSPSGGATLGVVDGDSFTISEIINTANLTKISLAIVVNGETTYENIDVVDGLTYMKAGATKITITANRAYVTNEGTISLKIGYGEKVVKWESN